MLCCSAIISCFSIFINSYFIVYIMYPQQGTQIECSFNYSNRTHRGDQLLSVYVCSVNTLLMRNPVFLCSLITHQQQGYTVIIEAAYIIFHCMCKIAVVSDNNSTPDWLAMHNTYYILSSTKCNSFDLITQIWICVLACVHVCVKFAVLTALKLYDTSSM